MKHFGVIPYIQYFKNLAALQVSLKGFYIMDINEILDGLRADVKYPALILNSVDGFISQSSTRDNILNIVKSGFLIIDHLDTPNDYVQEINILHNTFEIGTSILAKILSDSKESSPSHIGLDIDSIKYEMVDSIFDNDYGFLFTFDVINQILDLKYDSQYWLTQGKTDMSGY